MTKIELPDPREKKTRWASFMPTLDEVQELHEKWTEHNFPDQDAWVALGGMSEELGELWHAFIKHHQGIRSYDKAKLEAKIKDALGDIMIYMMHFANSQGVSVDECLRDSLAEVWDRDWQAYPGTGRPPLVEDEEEDVIQVDTGQMGNAPRYQ